MSLWKKYLITLGAALITVFVIICAKDIFGQTEAKEVFHILCDSFFAIGVVLSGFGILVFSSNEGIFDGIVYGVTSFLSMFSGTGLRKYDTFFDYKQSREGKKYSFGFLIICGLALVAVSLIMLFLYYQFQ